MKVVCDACGRKYSIDDSRISGQAFKIRCKQCAHVIVLRGRAPTGDPAPPGSWFAVIDGRSQPVALAELQRLRAAGELDDRSLIWREGFVDWCELGTVEELRPTLETAAAVPEADAALCAVTQRDAGAAVAPVMERAAETAGEPVLRNQRNQSSVLFSLRELAKIAEPSRPAASSAAGIEGSGLLDIRSIARGLAPARPERSAPDLPLFGPVALEPGVLVPPVGRGDRRLIWALAAAIGALAIVTTALLVIVLRGHAAEPNRWPAAKPGPIAAPAPQAGPAAPSSGAAPSMVQPPGAAPSIAQMTPPAPSATPPSAAATGHAASVSLSPAPPAEVAAASGHASGHTAGHTAGPASGEASGQASARASSASPAALEAAPPQPRSPAAESCSEITCLVNGYADKCCEIYRQPASLPEKLEREAVAAGLAGIDTGECRGSAAHGDVAVSVKVSPAGTVTSVTVKSSPDPALEACVVAAARQGTFAKTQRGGSFAYTWRF